MNDLISLEKIAQWQKLKTLVLDSVSSPITKRVYSMALDEFMGWFQQAPRSGFTKATVSAWRVSLEDPTFSSCQLPLDDPTRSFCDLATAGKILSAVGSTLASSQFNADFRHYRPSSGR